MIHELTVLNMVNKKEVKFTQDSGNLILNYVDWDSPSVTISDYRVPKQIGSTLSGIAVGKREPIIYGTVIADTSKIESTGLSWEEYYNKQLKEIEQVKGKLNKTFSIYEDVRIFVGNYYIDARPSKPVIYSNSEQDNNEVLCKFTIELECYNPMFIKENVQSQFMAVSGGFIFPIEIDEQTEPYGALFGEINNQRAISITNDGDVPSGATITIQALGDIDNPVFVNENTGEYIGFDNIKLEKGEEIIITTWTGEENAIKSTTDGSRSILGNIKEGSTFLKIERGENRYKYDIVEEQIYNINVSVQFQESYFNIEGM